MSTGRRTNATSDGEGVDGGRRVETSATTDTPPAAADFSTRDAARTAALRAALVNGGHWVVLVCVLVIGVAATVVLRSINESSLIYFGDTASHLVGARKLADWGDDPGLGRFGTVWLPLPHLLFLPFTLSTWLFSTGLAGAAVSLPSLAVTAMLLYKIIRRDLAGPAYLAAAGALLYALNPNVLYLGLIAMTEAPFMLFFVGAAYTFQKWYRTPTRLGSLAAASVLVALATLCRYEGWILAPFLFLMACVRGQRFGLTANRQTASLIVAALSFSGIALWAAYNFYQFGDPLEFANAPFYSAASQARTRDVRENLFLQPANIAWVYSALAFVMYGPILLSTALFGFVQLVRRRAWRTTRVWPLVAFLAMPPAFTLLSLLVGIGELSFWFNSRFLALAAPLLIILSAILVRNPRGDGAGTRRRVAGVFAACLVLAAGMVAIDRVPVVLDARGGFYWRLNPSSVEVGRVLQSSYDGGKIVMVTGSAQEHRIMLTAGIPLGQYDEILEWSTWKGAYAEPWRYGRWMVLGKDPDSDAVAVGEYWKERRAALDEHYDVTFENQYYVVLRLRDG